MAVVIYNAASSVNEFQLPALLPTLSVFRLTYLAILAWEVLRYAFPFPWWLMKPNTFCNFIGPCVYPFWLEGISHLLPSFHWVAFFFWLICRRSSYIWHFCSSWCMYIANITSYFPGCLCTLSIVSFGDVAKILMSSLQHFLCAR